MLLEVRDLQVEFKTRDGVAKGRVMHGEALGDDRFDRHRPKRFADVVHERDRVLLQIDETPRVGIGHIARAVASDHDFVRRRFVRGLHVRLNRDHSRGDLRLAASGDLRALRNRLIAGYANEERGASRYSFASYHERPQPVSTASGTASG